MVSFKITARRRLLDAHARFGGGDDGARDIGFEKLGGVNCGAPNIAC